MRGYRHILYAHRGLRLKKVRARVWGAAQDAFLLGGLVAWCEWTGRAVMADGSAFLLFAATFLVWSPLFFGRSHSLVLETLRLLWKTLAPLLFRRFHYRFGFDFRPGGGEKPFRDFQGGVALFGGIVAAVSLFGAALPGILGPLQILSGTLFLSFLGGLWILLILTAIAGAFGVGVLFHAYASERALRHNRAASARRRGFPVRVFLCVVLALGVATALEVFFGARGLFLAALTGAALHAALAFVPRPGSSPGLLIRRAPGPMRRMNLFQLEHAVLAIAFLWISVLMAVACGARAVPSIVHLPLPPAGGTLSLSGTEILGRGCAFVGFLFLLPATLHALKLNGNRLRLDPGSARRPLLTHGPGALTGPVPTPWRFRSATRAPRGGRADLDYDPDGARFRPGSVPPFRRPLEGKGEEERRFLLDHFDWITKRREFYRGLSRLLKIAAGIDFTSGGGYLLAPHHFFIEGMHRDDPGGEEGESRIIGPPFSRLWSRRTRQFLHEWLKKLEIDMIYFEDAVRWPQLRSVLDQAFERFMKTPGAGAVRESDFRFLRGVRVFIDEMEPDREVSGRKGYPEPHFANLSRARILMVFKDRGGEEERSRRDGPRVRVPEPLFG
jgi:hypothetical protein